MEGQDPDLWLDSWRFRPGALESDAAWAAHAATLDYPPIDTREASGQRDTLPSPF
jgi:hypothetical protein